MIKMKKVFDIVAWSEASKEFIQDCLDIHGLKILKEEHWIFKSQGKTQKELGKLTLKSWFVPENEHKKLTFDEFVKLLEDIEKEKENDKI